TRAARDVDLLAHPAAVDREVEHRSVRDEDVAGLERRVPRVGVEGPIELHVIPLDAGQRWPVIGVIGSRRRADLETEVEIRVPVVDAEPAALQNLDEINEIGRASCRERVKRPGRTETGKG